MSPCMCLDIFYQFFKMIIPVAKESLNFSSCNDIMVQGKADPKPGVVSGFSKGLWEGHAATLTPGPVVGCGPTALQLAVVAHRNEDIQLQTMHVYMI